MASVASVASVAFIQNHDQQDLVGRGFAGCGGSSDLLHFHEGTEAWALRPWALANLLLQQRRQAVIVMPASQSVLACNDGPSGNLKRTAAAESDARRGTGVDLRCVDGVLVCTVRMGCTRPPAICIAQVARRTGLA